MVPALRGVPTVSLRTRTDDNLNMRYRISADVDSWEERNPSAPGPLTRAMFDERLARTAASDTSEQNAAFVVDVDGAAVGSASLFGFDSLARHAEAGISLVPEARGRGVGTAAILQLVEFEFVRRNLRRIHLQAVASNTGALRSYQKAGFVVEGRLREHAWVRGAYEDIVLMGILRSEQMLPASPLQKAPTLGLWAYATASAATPTRLVPIAGAAENAPPSKGNRLEADRVAQWLDLVTAWRALSAGGEEVLALAVFDDLTSAQAARVIGVTPVAYRLRLMRGRRAPHHHLHPGATTLDMVSTSGPRHCCSRSSRHPYTPSPKRTRLPGPAGLGAARWFGHRWSLPRQSSRSSWSPGLAGQVRPLRLGRPAPRSSRPATWMR